MAVDINGIVEKRLRKIFKDLQEEFNFYYNGPLDVNYLSAKASRFPGSFSIK